MGHREWLKSRAERNDQTVRFAELLTRLMEAQYDERGQRIRHPLPGGDK